jgi:very-short-patch-repair endonuclease
VDVRDLLTELGGSASRADLLDACTDRQLREAVDAGLVVRVAHGRYGLARHQRDVEVARAFHGVLSHLSAALAHHWPVAKEPLRPVLTVPRSRDVPAAYRRDADFRYSDLSADEVEGDVTTPLRTVQDCMRGLPFDEALSVADSALRVGGLSREDLFTAARTSPRTGRPQALRVSSAADPRAATPFESVVRAIALEVPGLQLEPQVQVLPSITCDLVDESLRMVVECDSWTYHAEKSAFRRDQERFNELGLAGWLVIRIGMPHAMERPQYVRGVLHRAVRRLKA